MIICPDTLTPTREEVDAIFEKFKPEHPPAGLTFSNRYKPYITGIFSKEYYIILLTSGDMDDGESYVVGEWCDTFYKFKNEEDMNKALAYFAYVKREKEKKLGRPLRASVQDINGNPICHKTIAKYEKEHQHLFAIEND